MLISAFECPIINSVENYGGSSSSGGNEPEAEMATSETAAGNQNEPLEKEKKKKKTNEVLVALHAFVCPDIKLPDNLSECKCGIVTEFDWENLQPLELIK